MDKKKGGGTLKKLTTFAYAFAIVGAKSSEVKKLLKLKNLLGQDILQSPGWCIFHNAEALLKKVKAGRV